MLLFGQFNYGKKGILDATHTRLFTFRSLDELLDKPTTKSWKCAVFPRHFQRHWEITFFRASWLG